MPLRLVTDNIRLATGNVRTVCRQLLFSTDEDRAEMLGGTSMDDFIEAFERMTERWRTGHCAPALQERMLGIVEDLREFGLV